MYWSDLLPAASSSVILKHTCLLPWAICDSYATVQLGRFIFLMHLWITYLSSGLVTLEDSFILLIKPFEWNVTHLPLLNLVKMISSATKIISLIEFENCVPTRSIFLELICGLKTKQNSSWFWWQTEIMLNVDWVGLHSSTFHLRFACRSFIYIFASSDLNNFLLASTIALPPNDYLLVVPNLPMLFLDWTSSKK